MTLFHKGYAAFCDADGTMRDVVIVGYDHKKFYHLREPLPDGTICVSTDTCYTHAKLKAPVSKGLMGYVFSTPRPYKEPIEQESEEDALDNSD